MWRFPPKESSGTIVHTGDFLRGTHSNSSQSLHCASRLFETEIFGIELKMMRYMNCQKYSRNKTVRNRVCLNSDRNEKGTFHGKVVTETRRNISRESRCIGETSVSNTSISNRLFCCYSRRTLDISVINWICFRNFFKRWWKPILTLYVQDGWIGFTAASTFISNTTAFRDYQETDTGKYLPW